MPELNTERLNIVELSETDADFMFQLMNDRDWITNIGDRGIKTVQDARVYIVDKLVPAYNKYGLGFHLVKRQLDQKPLGICGIIKRPFLDHADIGFAFLPEFRRKGYAFEATMAIYEFAQQKLALDQISAITIPSNTPSISLLEKMGFTFNKMIEWPEDGEKLMYYLSQK